VIPGRDPRRPTERAARDLDPSRARAGHMHPDRLAPSLPFANPEGPV
jgi:hypothetical protein